MSMRNLTFIFVTMVATSFASAKPPIGPDEARPRLSWQDADKAIGRIAFISGRVAEVREPKGMTLIDFFDKKPATFTGVIRQVDYDKFPALPSRLYRDKFVRIRGLVTTYRGVPQIAITSPAQVEILDSLPEAEPPENRSLAPASDTLRFAQYNVLNLFDADDDPYCADEATPSKSRAELEALANTIRSLNADIIALEEVENRGYLERFLEVFLKNSGYKHVVLMEGNDRRGIDVALISRIPIGPVESNRHVAFPGPGGQQCNFARDVLEVTIEPENAPSFDVWIVHLQSNSQGRDYAEPIRVAEARQIRRMLDEELKYDSNARIILAGDFNDTWESETMKTIAGEGATSMWSAASDRQGDPPPTYNQEPYRSMIDFVLCSPAMAKQFVKGSFHVVPGSPESSGSDHNPVQVEFNLQTAP